MLMKRAWGWGHVFGGLALVTGGSAVVAACTHNDSTIFVRNVLAPQLVMSGAGCLYTTDPTQPVISSGVLDVDLRGSYDPTYILGNQMVPEVNGAQLQTETAIVTIQGAIVRITDVAGAQLKTFTRLTSTTLNPSAGSTPGFAPITVTTIDGDTLSTDPDIVNIVASGTGAVRLVTYVRFFGHTLGGKAVESNEFEFPVDVCKGCLIGFSASSEDPCFTAPNCKKPAMSAIPGPCRPGQDAVIDCSLCLGVPDCNPPAVNTCDAGAGGG
jgi:hypothetical protein